MHAYSERVHGIPATYAALGNCASDDRQILEYTKAGADGDRYGCASPIAKRFFSNIDGFAVV